MTFVGICGVFLLGTVAARVHDSRAAERSVPGAQIFLALTAALMITSQWL
jgi:hypothetical protein